MIVPAATDLLTDINAVSLPRYAQMIGYTECSFFGVVRVDDPVHSNKPLWVKSERDQVAYYLAEAQTEIENVIGYPLAARWIVNEQRTYRFPVFSRWNRVIEAGVRTTADIEAGAAVDHSADPAIVTVATAITDTDEIKVYHPGADIELHPSDITADGVNAVIKIPRCRMVKEADASDTAGLSYTDTTPTGPFLQTVDVKRVYNDPATNATLVWPHRCSTSCAAAGCSEYTRTACIYVKIGEQGVLEVLPATYSAGAWRKKSVSCCGMPALVRLNYRAGLTELTYQAEDAIVRLAHAKMPHSPCNCSPPLWLWSRDQNVPDILTRERYNCPFGMSDGAWVAWRFAWSMKEWRGNTL